MFACFGFHPLAGLKRFAARDVFYPLPPSISLYAEQVGDSADGTNPGQTELEREVFAS